MARYTKKIFIWIPRVATMYQSVWIDGSEVTEHILSASFTKAINNEFGNFNIVLANPNGVFSGVYSGNESVEFDMDEEDGSTLRFAGYINKIYPRIIGGRNQLVLTGFQVAGKLGDVYVTTSFTNVAISTILRTLFSEYAPDFTVENISDCDTTATINWDNKSLWDCIGELVTLSGFDFYIDDTSDAHFFESGSVENVYEALVLSNFDKMEYFGDDLTNVKNSVRYFGQTEEGLPIVYKSEDAASITSYGQKELPVKNTKANSSLEVEEKANALKDKHKDPAVRGKFITNQFLLTLKPGDLMWVSIPQHKIHDQYVVHKYTHQIPSRITTVQFKQEETVAKMIKDRVDTEQRIEDVSSTHGLNYSWAFPFDDETDLSELDDTQVTGGALTLATGVTSGSMTTITKNTGINPGVLVRCRLKVNGINLDNTTYLVTLDGTHETEVTLDSDYVSGAIPTAPDYIYSGTKIYIKVNLVQAGGLNPKINSMVLLFDIE